MTFLRFKKNMFTYYVPDIQGDSRHGRPYASNYFHQTPVVHDHWNKKLKRSISNVMDKWIIILALAPEFIVLLYFYPVSTSIRFVPATKIVIGKTSIL